MAIDIRGQAVAVYNTLKDAAADHHVGPDRIRKAIVQKRILDDLRWMYEEDFQRLVDRGQENTIAWGKWGKPRRRIRPPMSKETKEKISHTTGINKEYRQNVFAKSFIEFTKHHVVWMNKLKDEFLKTDNFGIRPETIVDYYTDKRDKEVALFSSLLISTDDNAKCLEKIMILRGVIGEHPWEWFKNRGFVNVMSIWHGAKKRVFELFDKLWVECFKDNKYNSLEECFAKSCQRYGTNLLETIETMCQFRSWRISRSRFALLMLVCSHSEGIGRGIWNIPPAMVRIPVTGSLSGFLRTWMPDAPRYGTPDECLVLFGMTDADFYFCHLAYNCLKKYHPEECSKYVTFYQTAYKKHIRYGGYDWRKHFPEINFSPKSEIIL